MARILTEFLGLEFFIFETFVDFFLRKTPSFSTHTKTSTEMLAKTLISPFRFLSDVLKIFGAEKN